MCIYYTILSPLIAFFYETLLTYKNYMRNFKIINTPYFEYSNFLEMIKFLSVLGTLKKKKKNMKISDIQIVNV